MISNLPNLSVPSMKRMAFTFLIMISSFISFAQVIGDYRSSANNANWGVLSSWQRYNGTTWVVPTSGQGYPGQNAGTQTVTIRDGFSINLNVSPANTISNLIIGTGGTSARLSFDGNSNQTLGVTESVTIGSNGTFNSTQNGNRTNTLSIGDDLSVASGGVFDMVASGGRTNVTFNGTGIDIGGGGTIEFNNVSFSNAGVANLTSNIVVIGNSTIGATTTLNAGSGTHSIAGNWVNSGVFVPETSTIVFNGANQTIGASNFNNVTFQGSGVKTLSATPINVAGNLLTQGTATITAGNSIAVGGNVTIASGSTFNAGNFTHTVAGNWTKNGTFGAGTGTINFNGTGEQNIGSSNFYNINFTDLGIKTATGALDINGNVTIGSNFTAGAFTHTVAGDWTNSGTFIPDGSTIYFDGTTGLQNISASPFNNVIVSNTGTRNLIGNITVTGNLTVSGGTLDLNDRVANGSGALNVGSGAILRIGGTNTLPTYSSYNLNAASIVIYDGGNQTIASETYGSLSLEGANSTKTLPNSAFTVAGKFSTVGAGLVATANAPINFNGAVDLGTGTTFNAGAFNHHVKGQWNNNIGTATPGAQFNADGGTITFDGTAAQIIDGNTTTIFNNLVINNAAGISLSQPETVTGELTLSNCILITTANSLLTLNDNATVVRTNINNLTTAFVDGPVRKIGDDAFEFPVGKIGFGYHPIIISEPGSVTDAFTAEYMRGNARDLGELSAVGLNKVNNCDYWNLVRSSGTSPVDVTLTWDPSSTNCETDVPRITVPYANVVAALFNGTSWSMIDDERTGNENNGTVTIVGVTDFTAFAIGTTRDETVLPVNFISIDAKSVGNNTLVSWKVAEQTDVLRYDVERSSNGINFSKIGEVKASDITAYSFTDIQPALGTVYYRVKNVDIDGKFMYSTVVSLRNGTAAIVVKAFPIPAKNNVTLQHGSAHAQTSIRLTAQDGRLLKVIRPAAGSMQTGIDLSAFAPGLYILSFDNGNGAVETIKLVKQ